MGFPIIGDILGAVDGILDKFIPDKAEKLRVQIELAKLGDVANERLHQEMMAQTEVNKVEASHRSIFVAGWRPFIGWGCGAALIYNTLVAPLLGTGQADLGFLQVILMGMLGIGAMRSYDKKQGTSDDVLPVFVKKEKAPEAVKPREPIDLLPENVPWMK